MKQTLPLFPVPVYFSQLTRKINKTENAFVEKQKKKLKNKFDYMQCFEKIFYPHAHAHPNSVISGVFYFKADLNEDKIFFQNTTYNQIYLEPKGFNTFNSSSWWFPIKNGELILFPSSTRHYVETKSTNNLRVSLAFNVFVKGKLGTKETLTELILK